MRPFIAPVLLFLSIFFIRCDSTEPHPPPPEPLPTITLAVEDVGVTEAWLHVSIPDTVLERTVILVRDSMQVDTVFLATNDSVLVDTGLLPNRLYTYKAYRLKSSESVDSTNSVLLTTMDTSSHAFDFVIDTLGVGNASVLSDVAIISENEIWAVGEIYLNDSTGQLDPIPYNLAVWNGTSWSIQRVPYDFQGSPLYSRIPWIFALDENDIWLGNGVHWNGQSFHNVDIAVSVFLGIGSNNMWGNPSGELYVVGNNGTIAYSSNHGNSWQQIESGTMLNIIDIFGIENPVSGESEIYAVASKQFVTLDRKILRIMGTSVEAVSDSGIPGSLQGVWFKPARRYYVAGNGLYSKRAISESGIWSDANATQYYLYGIRGADLNDVVACGAFGEVVHFNGVSWASYRSNTALSLGLCYRVAIKGNTIIAVGFDGARGVSIRGTR